MNRDEGRNCNSCIHNGYDSIRLACAFCVPQEASQWEANNKALRTFDELIKVESLAQLTRPELERLCVALRMDLAEERRLKSAIQAQANEELERRRAAEAQLLALKDPRP